MAAHLEVVIRIGATELRTHTAEVGRRGVFVVAERPWPRRKLVSLVLTLPDGEEFEVHGMVARTVSAVEAERGRVPPGMGIQFYGLSRLAQEQWESFFFEVTGEYAAPDKSIFVIPPPEPPVEPTYRPPSPVAGSGLEVIKQGTEPPRLGAPAGGKTDAPMTPVGPARPKKRRERAPSLVIVPTEKEPPSPVERQQTGEIARPEPGIEPPPRTAPLYPLDKKVPAKKKLPPIKGSTPAKSGSIFDDETVVAPEDALPIEEARRPPPNEVVPPQVVTPESVTRGGYPAIDEPREDMPSTEELLPDAEDDSLYSPASQRASSAPAAKDSEAPEGVHAPFTNDDQGGDITAIGAPEGLNELRERVEAAEQAEAAEQRPASPDVDGPTVIMDLPEELREPEEEPIPTAELETHDKPTMRKKPAFGATIPTVITPTELLESDPDPTAPLPTEQEEQGKGGLPYQETQPLAERMDSIAVEPDDDDEGDKPTRSRPPPRPERKSPTPGDEARQRELLPEPEEELRTSVAPDLEAELRTTVAPSKGARRSTSGAPVAQSAPDRGRYAGSKDGPSRGADRGAPLGTAPTGGSGGPAWGSEDNSQIGHWSHDAAGGGMPQQQKPMEWTPQGWQDEVNPPAGYLPPPSEPAPGLGLVPDDRMGYMVYRLALPTVEALQGFVDTALASKGVFVRTNQIRPPGTPAVVCVVHPLSGDEFHLPGEVVPVSSNRPGVAVQFQGVTARTIADFRYFIALGIPEKEHPSEPIDAHPEFSDDDDEVLTMINSSPRPEAHRDSNIPRENTHDVKLKDLHLFAPPEESNKTGKAPMHQTQEVSLAELINPEDLEDE